MFNAVQSTSTTSEHPTQEAFPQRFWVFRDGHNQQLPWAELTGQEKADTLEAEARASYNATFDPNYLANVLTTQRPVDYSSV